MSLLPPEPPPIPEGKWEIALTDIRVHDSKSLACRVGLAVRLFRMFKGLSQNDLATLMNCPRSYISKIENQKNLPTFASLSKLCRSFNISIGKFMSVVDVPVE